MLIRINTHKLYNQNHIQCMASNRKNTNDSWFNPQKNDKIDAEIHTHPHKRNALDVDVYLQTKKPIQMINTRKITFLNSKPNRVLYTGMPYILSNWFSIFGRKTVFAASFGLSLFFSKSFCVRECDYTHTAVIKSQAHTNILITQNTSTVYVRLTFRQASWGE